MTSQISVSTVSLSARRAWIEIAEDWLNAGSLSVALRKESVDRNCKWYPFRYFGCVALRKESVDRNFYYADKDADWVRVALRKESVDRNDTSSIDDLEPSSRSPQGERG